MDANSSTPLNSYVQAWACEHGQAGVGVKLLGQPCELLLIAEQEGRDGEVEQNMVGEQHGRAAACEQPACCLAEHPVVQQPLDDAELDSVQDVHRIDLEAAALDHRRGERGEYPGSQEAVASGSDAAVPIE